MSKLKIICTEKQKERFLNGLAKNSAVCPNDLIKKCMKNFSECEDDNKYACNLCFENEFNFIIKKSEEAVLDAINTIKKHCKENNCVDCILAKSNGIYRGACLLTEFDYCPSCWNKELFVNKEELVN